MTDYAELKRLAEAATETPSPEDLDWLKRALSESMPKRGHLGSPEGRSQRLYREKIEGRVGRILKTLSDLEASKAREEEARGLLRWMTPDDVAFQSLRGRECEGSINFGDAACVSVVTTLGVVKAARAFLSRGG